MTNAPLVRSHAPTLAGMLLGLALCTVLFPTVHAQTLPTLTLTSLSTGDVVTGVVRLTARASAAGLAKVRFQVSGADVGQDIIAGPCIFDWDTKGLVEGFYTVGVSGYDSLGNPVQAAPVTVNVQNTASTITNVQATNITGTSAVVSWLTSLTADSQIDYGTTAGYGFTTPQITTLVTNHAQLVSGLTPGTLYNYRVRSRDWSGLLSVSGNFTFTTATSSSTSTGSTSDGTTEPSSCTTSDPFVALGGGVCYNGGWLPPGMEPSGADDSTSSGSTTPTTSTLMVTSNNSCSTPDPFASMGGGTCVNGGWLPPGMYPAAPAPAPSAPAGSTGGSTPPSTRSDPGSSVGCTTPDPFAVLGGGTCHNGGWLPPGMVPPSTTSAPTAPTPTAVVSSGGCSTPDPFAAFSWLVGVCVNGGWVPALR